MKTAISIPDPLFASAESLADRLGISRSALYARALEEFLANQRAGAITRRLNAVYDRDPRAGTLDPGVRARQAAALSRADEW
jgi:hypothetical protein